jgi:hypothetical protein
MGLPPAERFCSNLRECGRVEQAELGPAVVTSAHHEIVARWSGALSSNFYRPSPNGPAPVQARSAGTPLVGRDEELALLQHRWQQAKSGEGLERHAD